MNLKPLFHDNPSGIKYGKSQKYVLLDRDGVINVERKNYVKSVNELIIYKETLKGLKILKENGYKVIVLTNQSPVGRGIITEEILREIHNKIFKEVEKAEGRIERFYFCPHKPEDNCSCRKPQIGMFLMAKKDFSINLRKTFYIGDKDIDVLAAKRAGCRSILIERKPYNSAIIPDFKVKNFQEAVKIVLEEEV